MTPLLTATYAAVIAILYIAMSAYVITMRAKTSVPLGDGGNPAMLLAMRRHGNMAEYAPFALLVMGLAEMNGLGAMWLHIAGAALIGGRLLHPLGLHSGSGSDAPRIAGTLATMFSILIPTIFILISALA
ncbi:MAG: MAPEG family protein [Silicimonas sp.]|jgi:hypothetical protein|nr:MAPEG family protein [Silicimonas sp.]